MQVIPGIGAMCIASLLMILRGIRLGKSMLKIILTSINEVNKTNDKIRIQSVI